MSTIAITNWVPSGPQSSLEKKYIDQFLLNQGYRLANLHQLPEEEAKRLMIKACTYASLKLAEVESREKFRQKIRRD